VQILRVTGLKDVPVWYEAGAYHFDFADTKALFCVQLLLMGFVETKRWMDFVTPGSQAAEDSFFGWEAAFEGLECGYPGGPLFDPMGLASEVSKSQSLKLKELKNDLQWWRGWVLKHRPM
jgi:light-harvesting complex I chlorophyll a/b binding protein 5